MANQDFNLTDFDPPTRHAKIQIFANKNKADDVDAIIYAE